MIYYLVHLLVDALVLLMAARIMSTVEVKNFRNALWVAFLVGVLNLLVGWLLRGVLQVATLGILYAFGLSFIIRIFVNGVLIEIVDKLSSGFNTKGFWPSVWLAAIIAIVGALVDFIFGWT